MSLTEVSLLIGQSAALVTALAAALSSWRNSRKIDASAQDVKRLEKNTNSISERNEAIAKQLGIVEGKATEKANPS